MGDFVYLSVNKTVLGWQNALAKQDYDKAYAVARQAVIVHIFDKGLNRR